VTATAWWPRFPFDLICPQTAAIPFVGEAAAVYVNHRNPRQSRMLSASNRKTVVWEVEAVEKM
jgi:hypothetical protein